MGFFGIGTGEILLVIVVALIIWGPQKLPEIARTLGKAMRTLKKASYDMTTAITREIDIKDDNRSQHPPEKPDNRTTEKPPAATKKTTPEANSKSENPEEHQQ